MFDNWEFEDSDFAGDLLNSHICSIKFDVRGTLIRVFHNSVEAEILSFGAKLRMVGIPALDLWDSMIEVLRQGRRHTSRKRVETSVVTSTDVEFHRPPREA